MVIVQNLEIYLSVSISYHFLADIEEADFDMESMKEIVTMIQGQSTHALKSQNRKLLY